MTKPRLTREYSYIGRRMMWFCRGAGSLGLGATATMAYWDWRHREEAREASVTGRKSSWSTLAIAVDVASAKVSKIKQTLEQRAK